MKKDIKQAYKEYITEQEPSTESIDRILRIKNQSNQQSRKFNIRKYQAVAAVFLLVAIGFWILESQMHIISKDKSVISYSAEAGNTETANMESGNTATANMESANIDFKDNIENDKSKAVKEDAIDEANEGISEEASASLSEGASNADIDTYQYSADHDNVAEANNLTDLDDADINSDSGTESANAGANNSVGNSHDATEGANSEDVNGKNSGKNSNGKNSNGKNAGKPILSGNNIFKSEVILQKAKIKAIAEMLRDLADYNYPETIDYYVVKTLPESNIKANDIKAIEEQLNNVNIDIDLDKLRNTVTISLGRVDLQSGTLPSDIVILFEEIIIEDNKDFVETFKNIKSSR